MGTVGLTAKPSGVPTGVGKGERVSKETEQLEGRENVARAS